MQFTAFLLPPNHKHLSLGTLSNMIALNKLLWIEAKSIFRSDDNHQVLSEISFFSKTDKRWLEKPTARRRRRRIHTFLQGSLCRQHYLVFPKTPALRKGKPEKVALGGSFSYIICNFGNLIYRQIFKYSQLTCTAIWKPHLEEDRCTTCRLGVSRTETAYKSSFQLRLTFYAVRIQT